MQRKVLKTLQQDLCFSASHHLQFSFPNNAWVTPQLKQQYRCRPSGLHLHVIKVMPPLCLFTLTYHTYKQQNNRINLPTFDIFCIIESLNQTHSGGKGAQEASSPTTCSKGQLESDQLTHSFIQLSLENLQGWRLHILSKQTIPLPDCSHRERDFPQNQSMLMVPNNFLLHLCRDVLQKDSLHALPTKQRGWWACSSLYCTFHLFWRLVHLPFSSHWGSSPISMTIQRWQKPALYEHKPAPSAPLDAAHFVPLTCMGHVVSSNPRLSPCPLMGFLVLLETFH